MKIQAIAHSGLGLQDRAQVFNTGITVIAGPMGSGKTTIVNALSLGLQGSTPIAARQDMVRLYHQRSGSDTAIEIDLDDGTRITRRIPRASGDGRAPKPQTITVTPLTAASTLKEYESWIADHVMRYPQVADLAEFDTMTDSQLRRHLVSLLGGQDRDIAAALFASLLDDSAAKDVLHDIIAENPAAPELDMSEYLEALEKIAKSQASVYRTELRNAKVQATQAGSMLDRAKSVEDVRIAKQARDTAQKEADEARDTLTAAIERAKQIESLERRKAEAMAALEAATAELDENAIQTQGQADAARKRIAERKDQREKWIAASARLNDYTKEIETLDARIEQLITATEGIIESGEFRARLAGEIAAIDSRAEKAAEIQAQIAEIESAIKGLKEEQTDLVACPECGHEFRAVDNSRSIGEWKKRLKTAWERFADNQSGEHCNAEDRPQLEQAIADWDALCEAEKNRADKARAKDAVENEILAIGYDSAADLNDVVRLKSWDGTIEFRSIIAQCETQLAEIGGINVEEAEKLHDIALRYFDEAAVFYEAALTVRNALDGAAKAAEAVDRLQAELDTRARIVGAIMSVRRLIVTGTLNGLIEDANALLGAAGLGKLLVVEEEKAGLIHYRDARGVRPWRSLSNGERAFVGTALRGAMLVRTAPPEALRVLIMDNAERVGEDGYGPLLTMAETLAERNIQVILCGNFDIEKLHTSCCDGNVTVLE